MRNVISILLIAIMCFSLVACGSSPAETTGKTSETSETTTAVQEQVVAQEPTENTLESEPHPENTVLHLNETVEIGDYEFTITDVRILKLFTIKSEPNSRQFGSKSDESYHVVVFYTMKNIGKQDISAREGSLRLEYSDGYMFDSDLYYHSSVNPDIFAHGGTQEMYADLEVLGKEKYFLESFTVPSTVAEDTNEPLKIHLNAACFNVDEINAIYNIRPIDEQQKEALYEKAKTFMNEGSYKQAVEKFKEIGDYKDSSVLYDECMKQWVLLAGTYYDDTKAYIEHHKDNLEIISGDKLAAILDGDFELSAYSGGWTFKSDGTIDDDWGNNRTWALNGDNLDLISDKKTDTVTVKKLCENGYLLFKLDGTFYSTMYVPLGK